MRKHFHVITPHFISASKMSRSYCMHNLYYSAFIIKTVAYIPSKGTSPGVEGTFVSILLIEMFYLLVQCVDKWKVTFPLYVVNGSYDASLWLHLSNHTKCFVIIDLSIILSMWGPGTGLHLGFLTTKCSLSLFYCENALRLSITEIYFVAFCSNLVYGRIIKIL